MARYDAFLRFAQRAYHRAPVSDRLKWRLRALLLPVLLSMRNADKPMSQAIRQVLAREAPRDNARELQLHTLMLDLANRGTRSVSHLIAVPFLGTGGAENVATNFAKAIRQLQPDSNVLLIVADREKVDERVSSIEGVEVVVLRHYTRDDSYVRKQELLEDVIVALRPKVFHNINSEVAWNMIIRSGARLQRHTKLFASIFAFQFASDGVKKIGYAAYFLKPGLPSLTALLSDNHRFVIDARREYELGLSGDKLKAIYNPSRIATEDWKRRAHARIEAIGVRSAESRPTFLWAGRLDREKRVDLLIEMIRRMPNADFYVYGQTVVDSGEIIPKLPNLYLMGPFSSPQELVEERVYSAFIFTSKWEGLPNILLEIGTLGIPIVAPAVGGVGEVITDATGYLLPSQPTVEQYLAAMDEVINNPRAAQQKSLALVDLIGRRHSWEAFVEDVQGIDGYGV